MSESRSLTAPALDPNIRENVCFVGYDPQRRTGYLIQLSRWCHDAAIWRETVQIFLPDGSYLLHRGWGADASRTEPAGALLKVTCEAPERRWRLRYRGPARHTSADELKHGPLQEHTPELVDFDITFESRYEVWEQQSRSADSKWGHTHAEQPGRIRGRIGRAGQAIDIDGNGYRNQSRGTRALSALFDHCWTNGAFPCGRAFAISAVRMQAPAVSTAPVVVHARIWDAGQLHIATCKTPPLLGDTDFALTEPGTRCTLDLESELGTMRIDVHAVASIPHSTTMDGDWLDGVVTDPSLAYLVAYERPTMLSWNGEQGCGHIEQSRRVPRA